MDYRVCEVKGFAKIVSNKPSKSHQSVSFSIVYPVQGQEASNFMKCVVDCLSKGPSSIHNVNFKNCYGLTALILLCTDQYFIILLKFHNFLHINPEKKSKELPSGLSSYHSPLSLTARRQPVEDRP